MDVASPLGSTDVPCDEEIARLRPDVILVDEMSSRRTMLMRIREARSAAPAARIVLVARELGCDAMREATEAGADAAICRSTGPRPPSRPS